MKTGRLWPAGVVLAALGLMALGTGRSGADDEDKETRDALLKVAATIKAGKDADAKKQALALAKKIDTVEEVMDLFKPRKKNKKGKYVGGLGVGEKPGGIIPDGIELKLLALGRDAPTPAALAKESGALQEMGYVIIAVAEVAHAEVSLNRKYVTGKGAKTKKAWEEYAQGMRESAGQFAAAAKAKGAQQLKAAATKLNNNCTTCHNVFKPKGAGG